jgi:hypothetical protein
MRIAADVGADRNPAVFGGLVGAADAVSVGVSLGLPVAPLFTGGIDGPEAIGANVTGGILANNL